jgi:hypothetical protein
LSLARTDDQFLAELRKGRPGQWNRRKGRVVAIARVGGLHHRYQRPEGKGRSPGKTTGRPAEAHMIIVACTRLLEREPVEIAYRVVVSAAIHDELQGVQTLRKFDGGNLERLPGLPTFGLRN